MTILSRLLGRLAGLPPATTHAVQVERGLRIPVAAGVELQCDRYAPQGTDARTLPILLNRTPYGRKLEGLVARLYAERGFQAVVVSCRGTFGSGGDWEPFFNEQADGHAVLDWISKQDWFSGRVGTFGGSYHGLTQWSVAERPPEFLQAMVPLITQSQFADFIHPGGSFALESALTWIGTIEHQELPLLKWHRALKRVERRLGAAARVLPLRDADTALIDHPMRSYQDWLANETPTGPYWSRIDFGKTLTRVPPMLLVAGWYDIFGMRQLHDAVKLRQAGRAVRLVVGPWTHGSLSSAPVWIREIFHWMNRYLKDRAPDAASAHGARLFVMGARRWVDVPQWPVPAKTQAWHLHADGQLRPELPAASAPDRYRYDPADPTPVLGGPSLYARHAGPKDNRPVEARKDVLLYTSAPLEQDLTVIGPIHAELHLRSSLDHTDFYVRLCDVFPGGKSINLCEGIRRLRPADITRAADGSFQLRLELGPTANTFKRGHRVRIQVSSGAFPLYARNTGSGEPLASAARLVAADQEVLHDPAHPSRIELPVVEGLL